MNRSARKYYASVSRLVNLPGKRRKALLSELRTSLEKEPEREVAQYQQAFGRPEDVSNNFFGNADGKEISKGLRTGHALVGIAAATAVLVVGIVLVSRVRINNEIRNNLYGYFEYSDPIVLAEEKIG